MEMRVLIVEDNLDFSFFVCAILRTFKPTLEIFQADTLEKALPLLLNTDLVITDFEFPTEGFPAFLPYLKEKKHKFILQSAERSHLRMYDQELQIGTLYKDSDFMQNMIKLLRFNNIS
jgi:DNA-binding response OmpR family regulator